VGQALIILYIKKTDLRLSAGDQFLPDIFIFSELMASEKKTVLLIILICCLGNVLAQNDSVFKSKTLSSFRLYNTGIAKNIYLPDEGVSKPFSLFIFLSPECPLSQNYLPLFNSLSERYTNDISFYGIIPGKSYSAKIIRKFASAYNVRFPLLIDSSKSLSNYMKATVTPEIILLNNKHRLVYKGAVDDLLTGLGKRKIRVANEYLKNAIAESLGNKQVSVKRTKAVGCKINDY
jgi:thiol-disulfide isomerase/thioredoxin